MRKIYLTREEDEITKDEFVENLKKYDWDVEVLTSKYEMFEIFRDEETGVCVGKVHTLLD